MLRKPFLLLFIVVASAGLVAAGCGSSSSHTSTPATSPAGSTSGASASSTPATTTSSSSSSSSSSSNPAVAQAVTACKTSINSAPTLSSSEKSKLTALCDKAANGDLAGVKKIAAEVCKDVVNASVPAGSPTSVKNQALAACKKA